MGIDGHCSNRPGCPKTVPACSLGRDGPPVRISGGTSCRKYADKSNSGLYPPAVAAAILASTAPVFAHQSPAVSPGSGIIALTKTSERIEVRAQTSGAVNAPSDWATRTTSERWPIARIVILAYSCSPALSSSPGRSAAPTPKPAFSNSGTTLCQYQAIPPAPGIRMNDGRDSGLFIGSMQHASGKEPIGG